MCRRTNLSLTCPILVLRNGREKVGNGCVDAGEVGLGGYLIGGTVAGL
jgi:hypothetical protein